MVSTCPHGLSMDVKSELVVSTWRCGRFPILQVRARSSVLLYDINVKHLDILLGFLLVRPYVLDFVDDVKSLGSTTKNGVLSV